MHSFDETKLSDIQRDILNRCLKDNSLVKNLNREIFHYSIFKVCTSLSVWSLSISTMAIVLNIFDVNPPNGIFINGLLTGSLFFMFSFMCILLF